jgi:hypothetical protein
MYQKRLATIMEDYAVKNRTRNKVILVPGNVQNAGFIPFKPLSIRGPRRPPNTHLIFLLVKLMYSTVNNIDL